jgi:hypothetical protein
MFVLLSFFSLFYTSATAQCPRVASPYTPTIRYGNHTTYTIFPKSQCTSFSLGPGTGCAWMCSYCANTLGTNNYYFSDGICKYDIDQGGCVGTPVSGVTYTCCAV